MIAPPVQRDDIQRYMDCATCATVIEHTLRRMDGLLLKEIAKQGHIPPFPLPSQHRRAISLLSETSWQAR